MWSHDAAAIGDRPIATPVPALLPTEHRNQQVQVIGISIGGRSVSTARKRVMGFITIEDDTGICEVTIPPKLLLQQRRIVYTQGPFLIQGKVVERFDAVSIEAEEISIISSEERNDGRG